MNSTEAMMSDHRGAVRVRFDGNASGAVVFAVALALFGTGACSSKYERVSGGCSATSGCPLGSVCNVPSNECEPEPVNRFLGSFSCEFTQSGTDTAGNIGSTDVLGSVGQERMLLNLMAMCNYSAMQANMVVVSVVGMSTSVQRTLQIVVPNSVAGQYSVISPDVWSSSQPAGYGQLAVARDPGDPAIVAKVSTGSLSLYDGAKVGSMLSGYLDVSVVPAQ